LGIIISICVFSALMTVSNLSALIVPKIHTSLQSRTTITATTSGENKQSSEPTKAKIKPNRIELNWTEAGTEWISRERCGDSEIRQNAPSAQRRLSRNDIVTRPEDWMVQHSLGGRVPLGWGWGKAPCKRRKITKACGAALLTHNPTHHQPGSGIH